ncbi:MAG: YdcF family protein [Bacteriovoracales bacterium]|nr:YdcF family protein [Bacteriovoracales bacterium]
MFGKKYIFETSKTRYKRYFINIVYSFLILGVFYVLFSFYLLYFGRKEMKSAQDAFYQKSPDLIVVFTGDVGRIPLAIELSKKFKTSKIFITGVYARNTVDHLLRAMRKDDDPHVDSRQIEIDYLARNTVENVLSTLQFLKNHQELKRVLLVSSDYHIYRIKRITETLSRPKDSLEFHYQGTVSDLKAWRSYRLIFKETSKIIKALAFLLLWDGDQETPRVSIPQK